MYLNGDENMLNDLRGLWEALNLYYRERSSYFKLEYCEMTFEKRKAELLKKNKLGKMRVDLAVDKATGQKIGYCVSSLDKVLTGEIDSIFMDSKYRRQGIGRELMQKALTWLDSVGAKKKFVSVGVGNEQVYGFYAKFGFLPRRTILEQKNQLE